MGVTVAGRGCGRGGSFLCGHWGQGALKDLDGEAGVRYRGGKLKHWGEVTAVFPLFARGEAGLGWDGCGNGGGAGRMHALITERAAVRLPPCLSSPMCPHFHFLFHSLNVSFSLSVYPIPAVPPACLILNLRCVILITSCD